MALPQSLIYLRAYLYGFVRGRLWLQVLGDLAAGVVLNELIPAGEETAAAAGNTAQPEDGASRTADLD